MNHLLLTTLLLASSQDAPSVKFSWYGTVPNLIDKTILVGSHLTFEFNPIYKMDFITLEL
ncbi:hypothetical protein [Vibrio chagasii]|uniref:hypothetical protein n=1 Tax=Vibrio chagasii TaxID=170679 RepID=UPI003D9FC667